MTKLKLVQALTDRQTRIIAQTEQHGFVTIEKLAEEFGVSAQTVRRDIIALSEAGRLQRFHGGAGPISDAESLRLDHSQKSQVSVDAKVAAAKAASELIPDGSSVYLDVGTTVEFAAKELSYRGNLSVFTNSMRAGLAFDPKRHNIQILGGRMAGKDGSLVGEDIVLSLNGLNIDFALIACSAIDNGGRVMDFDMSKIAVKRAAMKAASTSILVVTPSKFGRSALSTIATKDDFQFVITGE